IQNRTIPGSFGETVVNIYYGGKGGVALTRRGSTIASTISIIPDIEGEVWRSGKISGTIRCDFLNVSTDKKSPIRDERFRILLDLLRQLEPEIVDWVKKLEEME